MQLHVATNERRSARAPWKNGVVPHGSIVSTKMSVGFRRMALGSEVVSGRRLDIIARWVSFPPCRTKSGLRRYGHLNPIEAVRRWLGGDFGIDDEPAMIEAIRKDPRVSLSDDKIIELMGEAIDEGWEDQACLERLASTA